MKKVRIVFAVLTGLLVVTLSQAQPQPALQSPSQDPGWNPPGMERLRQSASSKTEFTIDHTMLVLASKLDPGNGDLRRVIAGINGVSVHSFRYSGRTACDSGALQSMKDDYRSAGWTQVMKDENVGTHSTTNLWMRMENNAISKLAVLVVKPAEVDLVAVSGSISPIDLSHLGGHLGIPKIEGGVVIPNGKPQP
jgi:hypothetical protein